MADESDSDGALLIIDEVRKAADWAEAVKRLWDEDTRTARRLKKAYDSPAGGRLSVPQTPLR
ncbi:hypothetical protein [Candidatus Palauibacter sp.]|uniref:hypothetical protein n=1 Tax=Candidatus Palauibacter sp. TaxID=3101350 RepID=UPI003B0129A6